MAAREDGRHDLLDDLRLADYRPAELLDHLVAGLAKLGQILADAIAGHRANTSKSAETEKTAIASL